MLTITTREDLEEQLLELGLKSGDDVIVHSSLIRFGLIEGGPGAVYQALRNVIGVNATLVVPTYLLGAPPEQVYDPLETPSLACGSFSEYVRRLDGAVRSWCPLHNHAGVGPKANLLHDVDGSVSLGQGSDFGVLHKAGFLTLLLGCRFHEGATFVMNSEALAEVPFREWVNLKRSVVIEGRLKERPCWYYQRKGQHIVESLEPVHELLKAAGYLRASTIRGAESTLVLRDAYEVTKEAFRKEPTLTLVAKD